MCGALQFVGRMQRMSEGGVPQNKASRVMIVTQSQAHQGHRDAGSGVLTFDPALLRAIAERVGTPTYVYSANLIRAQYHALHDALKDVPHRICYSVKANGNIGVLRVLKAAGAGADIVSVGELRRALAAGFDAASIVFSGVGKTALELEEAIRIGVGFLNVESPAELDAVIAVAHRLKKRANLGIRVNPDVATETHPYTKTGEKTAKFGVPYDEVVSVARRIAAEPLFTLRGLAMHLGSQITDVEPYHRGTVKLLELVTALRVSGITTVEALDVGGGLGVKYHNEKAPSPQAFAEAVAPPIKQAGLALICEPGRYLVANAGVLVTRVLYRKHAGGKEFVVVDAGMTDFVRPSHYNAHHEIVPLQNGGRAEELVNIVGPICESGDFLALDRKLPTVEPGEYLAVLGTGAYGFVMSSTTTSDPGPLRSWWTGIGITSHGNARRSKTCYAARFSNPRPGTRREPHTDPRLRVPVHPAHRPAGARGARLLRDPPGGSRDGPRVRPSVRAQGRDSVRWAELRGRSRRAHGGPQAPRARHADPRHLLRDAARRPAGGRQGQAVNGARVRPGRRHG